MNSTATRLPYRQTHAFTKIAVDYIDQVEALKPFFAYTPSVSGMQQAIADRKKFQVNRNLLVQVLNNQYEGIETAKKVRDNIAHLGADNCFTITTAHQNNLFTGPLYFLYKIIHVIKLADQFNSLMPGNHFVPVFYIGSEDADLDELNHTWIGSQKLIWETRQTGAVGRMLIDKNLLRLIDEIDGQLSVEPFGKEVEGLLKACYQDKRSIADATFRIVNRLFADRGLVVLQPDNEELKRVMIPFFRDELFGQHASGIVEGSTQKLEKAGYKVQAHPREINLFYLNGNKRERIVSKNGRYQVLNTDIFFDKAGIENELKEHPGRFSPNVILRGLYQETILPNIAFIGGAGETAYWLQLKDLFTHYQVPFPVLVLRNSFLLVEKKWQERIQKLGFTAEDLFAGESELLNRLVSRESHNRTSLNGSLAAIDKLYDGFRDQAVAVDASLEKHVEALKTKTLYRLQELEKKMLRAEKRKFSDQQRQIQTILSHLFPGGGLQERRENFSYYYARWGKSFLDRLYEASPALEQEFVVLLEK